MDKFIPFKEIEHTADLAIQIFGRNLEELFHNAHQGFYTIVFGNFKKIQKMANASQDKCPLKTLQLEETSLEDLLHSFLSELNYHLQSKRTIFSPLLNLEIHQTSNGARLRINATELKLSSQFLAEADITEIKAVTYHGLKFVQENGLWSVTVIFDI
ncbi:MAG TPA: archease [Caldithrix abyssi]|uniref:Archease n=1 Tax=Caldithrix abyssi TaxID=187145 RepID=A0A7V5LK92_CALAY|nr:archease [Caldisericaceae bacterium]HHE55498.1 archease [Caldithrix abyssi]